jgi:hypothetical protein
LEHFRPSSSNIGAILERRGLGFGSQALHVRRDLVTPDGGGGRTCVSFGRDLSLRFLVDDAGFPLLLLKIEVCIPLVGVRLDAQLLLLRHERGFPHLEVGFRFGLVGALIGADGLGPRVGALLVQLALRGELLVAEHGAGGLLQLAGDAVGNRTSGAGSLV